jgi:hypothetical protein
MSRRSKTDRHDLHIKHSLRYIKVKERLYDKARPIKSSKIATEDYLSRLIVPNGAY